MSASISAELISLHIGRIYDSAIAPDSWHDTLDCISRDFGMYGAVMAVQDMASGTPLFHVSTGPYKEWPLDNVQYILAAMDLWGGVPAIADFPLDEPKQMSINILNYSKPLEENIYWRDWVGPANIIDGVAIGVSKDETTLGSIGFGRQEKFGFLSEVEIDSFRTIAPHFRRAIEISRLLDIKTVISQNLEATLNQLNCAVLVVGVDMKLLHSNNTAELLLAEADVIRVSQGRLLCSNAYATNALHSAVGLAGTTEYAMGQKGLSLPLRTTSGAPIIAHVLPLGGGEIRPQLKSSAVAAIFISPARSELQLPSAALTILYDLTPMECRIFELIAMGESPASIANRMAIAASTVKTHLLRVFQKTGCKRQSELVKLSTTLAMPY